MNKMYKSLIVLSVVLALSVAQLPKNDQRESSGKVENGMLELQHHEKIFENSNHRVDGSALYRQDLWNKQAPKQFGGRVDYNNKNSNTNVGIDAINAGRFGTQFGVDATKQIYKGRNSAWEIGGRYDQRFGGPGGRGEPSFGGFVRGRF